MITPHYHECAVCRDPIECHCTDETQAVPRLCARHAKEQKEGWRALDNIDARNVRRRRGYRW